MEPSTQQTSTAIPIAIIVGFAMIAIAIFFTNRGEQVPDAVKQQAGAQNQAELPNSSVPPISKDDYTLGNPNAPIVLIEYSDYECPFCKQYHSVLHQIMDEYGVGGKVAWVYRQFPLTQLHPNAAKISEAALCVGSIGGNDAFWEFTNRIFDERDLDTPTNVTKLPQYAEAAGVLQKDYVGCINDGFMEAKVL